MPDSNILRMDADTTSSKYSYDDMLASFRNEEYDILIGTQMVAKGHDFPKVSLVGVLSADSALYVNDFRASERTFALITQVIGRAGRGDIPGEAVIQTYKPENEIIVLASHQNYEKFYEREIERRKQFLFPPFCDIVTLTLTSEDEKRLKDGSDKLSEYVLSLAKDSKDPLMIFGPIEAPVYKVMGKYRMKMVIKTKIKSSVREMLSSVMTKFSSERGIILTIDINPTNT